MADISATGPAIQRDWDNRDFTQGIQLNILKITQFLNRFGKQGKCARAVEGREPLGRERRLSNHVPSAFRTSFSFLLLAS